MNASGLLQSKCIHDSMNITKIEFIACIDHYCDNLKYEKYL